MVESGAGRGRLGGRGRPSDLSELLGPDSGAAAEELGAVVRTILGGMARKYRIVQEQFDDLLQDVLLKCVQQAERIRRGEAAPLRNRDAWLVRVTQNAVLSAGRAASHRRDDSGWPEGFEPPSPRSIPPEERLTLRRALAALDDLCRKLLILRDVMGEARTVIAAKLEMTANALGVRLHRCRRKLLELVTGASTA